VAATSVKQVFISHATEADGEFAGRLAGDLRRLGVRVWIAPDSIPEGEQWVDAIERGLGESSHIVVVLTPAALKSRWVKRETNAAMELENKGRMQVIPLDVEPCEAPLLLSGYQMVRFRGGYEAGLSQLGETLELGVAQERRQPLEPELIRIPAGESLMGSTQEQVDQVIAQGVRKEWVERELPQHPVDLPDYHIARAPVTNAQYLAFVEVTGQKPPWHWKRGKPPDGKEEHPVVEVSWYDALAYCHWMAEATGKAYRLPSEAEWEKAARGSDGRIWPWGNERNEKRCNSKEDGPGATTSVGQYSPRGDSPYGCVDVAGNVWEWCNSLLEPYPYEAKDGREDTKARGPRVLRGGAFSNSQGLVRCACRVWRKPDNVRKHVGFRVCVAPGDAFDL
jgi:formylglycine-generating enzyme required for sulfatase activity